MNTKSPSRRKAAWVVLGVVGIGAVIASAPLWPGLLEDVMFAKLGSVPVGRRADKWLEMVEVENRFTGEPDTWVVLLDTGETVLRFGKTKLTRWRRVPGGVQFTLRDGTQHVVMRPQLLPTWWNGVKAPLSRKGRLRELRR